MEGGSGKPELQRGRMEKERERWSECGVGSLNFEYEEWRVIKKKGRNGGRK